MAKTKTSDIKKYVKEAFDYQDVDNWKSNCKRWLAYFKGDWNSNFHEDSYKYVVNTFYNLINLYVPNLYFTDPHIVVKPKRRWMKKKTKDGYEMIDNVKAAELFEKVLNHELKKIGYGNEVRKCIQDACIFTHAPMKVGFSMTTVSEDNNEYILDESVFAQRISPFDYGFDPIASNPENTRYEIHRLVKTKKDVKDNYGIDTKDITGSILVESKKKRATDSKTDSDDFVTIDEVHDHTNNTICDYIHGRKKNQVVEKKKNPHDFIGSHFSVLRFTGDNDQFRGISILGTVEDEALALNDAVSNMVQHMSVFSGQIFCEEGAIDEDQALALENGELGSILFARNGALREGRIRRESPVPMGNDYFNVFNQLQTTIDRILGVPDFQQSGSSRKTATEATFEQADSTIRREYFLKFVKDFILNSVGKIAGLIQQYYDKEYEIRIDGEHGTEFINYTKEDIQGEFDFDFDIQNMKFYRQSKLQQMTNALNILGSHAQTVPAFAEALKGIDGKKLGKELFKQLELNYDSFSKGENITHMEKDPYEENELVAAGKRLTDPYVGEPHDEHLPIHLELLKQLMQQNPDSEEAKELRRHVEMTFFTMQGLEQVPGSPVSQIAQGQQPAQQQGQPQQPKNPAQAPTDVGIMTGQDNI